MEESENKTEPEGKLVVEEVATPQKEDKAQTEKVLEEEKANILKRFWYFFLIFGVVIVISLGMLVYGYQKMSQEKPAPSPTPTPIPTPTEEVDEQTSALEVQGVSDEVEDIETDLEATDLSEIDQELEDIDSELSSP